MLSTLDFTPIFTGVTRRATKVGIFRHNSTAKDKRAINLFTGGGSMQNFVFENPTRIIFGQGMIARIGGEVKRFGSKVLACLRSKGASRNTESTTK